MRKVLFGVLMTLALLIASAPGLLAQETTGAIEGVVRDAGGAVLPGVTVTATGPVGTLTTVSDGEGRYRFPRLPSGRYTVRAALDGFAPATSTVDLVVGSTNTVPFELAIAGLTETIEVSGAASPVDLRSPQTATSISRERLELIPRGRDFTDVVAQAAGAANESQAGGISIDGSSGSENRFVIDGIDTTSPQVGTNAVPMRAEFLEEVQVKSAGYAAEFGGSTGGVINAITKSGTNELARRRPVRLPAAELGRRRAAAAHREPHDRTFSLRPAAEGRRDPDRSGLLAGRADLRDRAWFFGSYQPGIRNTERTVTSPTA
jgi:hypothetical protein